MSVSSYTNVQNVLNYYPLIGSATNINSASIFGYVQAVHDEIDQALSKLYTLPRSETIPVLQTLATRMTVFDILTIRAAAQWTGDQASGNPFFGRLKEARKLLEDIRDGKASLLDSTGQVITERTDIAGAWSNNMDYLPTMHEGPITDTVVDSNKLTDLLDERSLNGDE